MRNRNRAQGPTRRIKKNLQNPLAMRQGNRQFGRGWCYGRVFFEGLFDRRRRHGGKKTS